MEIFPLSRLALLPNPPALPRPGLGLTASSGLHRGRQRVVGTTEPGVAEKGRRSRAALWIAFLALLAIARGANSKPLFPGALHDAGTQVTAVTVVDVNHDGKPDVVTAGQPGTVLIGQGSDALAPRLDYATGVGANVRSL